MTNQLVTPTTESEAFNAAFEPKPSKAKGARPSRHFQIADKVACLLQDILPQICCTAAVATCRFVVQGPESVGQKAQNWGQWIRTSLQTFGYRPDTGIWQGKARHWISGDSHGNAEAILRPFGITVNDVLDEYGTPKVGEKYQLDLVDVIERLASGLLKA